MGAKTGPRDSLEAELADLERDWEELERATAQTAAQDKVQLIACKIKPAFLTSVTMLIWASRPVAHAFTGRLPRYDTLRRKPDRTSDKLQCIDYTQQRALQCCLGGMKKSFRPAQTSGMQGEEDEASPPQKGVASVIERWESRNLSAEALQHMHGSAVRSSWTSEGSASDAQEGPSVRVSMAISAPSIYLHSMKRYVEVL